MLLEEAAITAAIEMRSITKRFPGVLANDDVRLTIQAGEIHALLGENGAGKSTLMQILYGLHHRDSGHILVRGKEVEVDSPKEAIDLGIGMLQQRFALVQSMTVLENTILGLKEKPGPMLDLASAAKRIWRLSEQHQLAIDPDAIVGFLPMGVQQRVEILKLLYRNASVLILDEPTAILTPPEKDRLFAVLRSLREEGRSIIIVTHKLHEIMELADHVTVMRDGRVVASLLKAATTGIELARLMVGRDVNVHAKKAPVKRGDCVLRISDLHVRGESGDDKVCGISLNVHAGEIVGIAGVDGNGQSELAQAILSLRTMDLGAVFLKGEEVTCLDVAQHRSRGLAYIPADRHGVGSVAELSLADNAILGSQRTVVHGPFLSRMKIREYAQTLITRFGVRSAGIDTPVGKLSGGNLQKVILGREIMRKPVAMIIEQPTRGLDVGAIEAVWKELLAERERGTAILLISAELEELMNLADRIAVIFEGKIIGIVDAADVTIEALGLMMTGVTINATPDFLHQNEKTRPV